MTLKIKTTDIELEYTDNSAMLEEATKTRLIGIIEKLYSFRIIHFDYPTNQTTYDTFTNLHIKK